MYFNTKKRTKFLTVDWLDSQILSRYYMDKVLFRRPKSTTKTSSTSRDFSAMPAHNSVMVATSLGLRIAVASHQHAIDFEPSRAYGTADLWTELFACRQFILRYINESINDINGAAIPSAVVRQICNMTTIDVSNYISHHIFIC